MTAPPEGQRWQRTASAPPLLVRPARRRSLRSRLTARALNASLTLACNAHRVAYSSASGLLALTSVALGTYAGFSAQVTTPGNTFATGSLAMSTALGAPMGPGAFTFGTVSDILPGESIVRFLDISNDGTLAFSVQMTSAATAGSALDTDATNGLQLEIKQCSQAWSAADVCSGGGTVSTVRASGPIATSPIALGTVPATAANVAHLQLKVSLPTSAAGAGGLTGQTSTLQLTLTATNQ
jgi:spore coat-associated protein N